MSKADTFGTNIFVRFRQVSSLEHVRFRQILLYNLAEIAQKSMFHISFSYLEFSPAFTSQENVSKVYPNYVIHLLRKLMLWNLMPEPPI